MFCTSTNILKPIYYIFKWAHIVCHGLHFFFPIFFSLNIFPPHACNYLIHFPGCLAFHYMAVLGLIEPLPALIDI